jgi:hypothetical protein
LRSLAEVALKQLLPYFEQMYSNIFARIINKKRIRGKSELAMVITGARERRVAADLVAS